MESDYADAEAARDAAFQAQLANMGYELPSIPYAAGILVERETQLIERMGEFYRAKPGVVPFTTTGTWAADELNLVAVGDAALRTELASPGGSSLMAFDQGGPGSVSLTAAVKMGERMSIMDKGAIPGVDCASAILSALASTPWDIYVPRGAFIATVTAANAASIFSALDKIKIDGTLTLTVDPVLISGLSTEITINSPDAQKIALVGAAPISTTATSQISVSGSAKAYSVTIGVASSAGAVVGDYAKIFTNITGTGDYYAHAGAWEITGVDVGGANRLTLRNTHHGAAFPTNTLTGGTVRIIKSILQFSGCDGFRLEGGQPFGLIDNLIIKGDWNLVAATGTMGAHGIVTASPRITGGGSSNAVFNTAGNGAIGENVGVVSFGEQGIAISGRGVLVANSVASCSNRKRGWYAEGGHIRDKSSVGSGNGEDGFIADTTGFIQAALSWACGNGLNGFWSTNNSLIAAATSVASGNLTNGYEARGLTRIGGDLSKSLNNGSFGYSATDGGMIDGDGSLASGNGAGGYEGVKGIIDAKNSSSINNTGYGYRGQAGSMVRSTGSGAVSGNTLGSYRNNESIVIDLAGASVPQDVPTYSVGQRFYDQAKALYMGFGVSSIGDMTLSTNTTPRYVFKADGTQHPSVTNANTIGRQANIYSAGYMRQVLIGAAAVQLISGGPGSPEGAVTAPVGSQWLRSDGGAATTLYVKETGVGNTGWVAK